MPPGRSVTDVLSKLYVLSANKKTEPPWQFRHETHSVESDNVDCLAQKLQINDVTDESEHKSCDCQKA